MYKNIKYVSDFLSLTDLVLVRGYTRFRCGHYENVCTHYRRRPRSKYN